MNTYRTNAIMVGVLFIVGTAAGVLSLVFTNSILTALDYLMKVSANENQIILGALCILLMLIGALIVSIVMLRSDDFSKGTAYVGIVTHGLDLLRILISFFVPQAGIILMAIAGPLYLVWFPLLARDFFRLSRSGSSDR